MKLIKLTVVASALALGGLFWAFQAPAPVQGSAPAEAGASEFVVRDVRVFDGEAFIDRSHVHVRDGLIHAVGPDIAIPDGVAIVEGRGRTLLPGLIDAHVHTWGEARADALRFGVTSQIDMFSDPAQLPEARRQRASLDATAQADLWSAGLLATADGGHGTQFGVTVPTLAAPADASGWVADRQAEGSDFIKIVREDLQVYDSSRTLPSLDADTAAAVIAAAHERGLRAVVHASAQEAARESVRDGADGLVHVFQDAPADAAFVSLARDKGAFVVPTLSVVASIAGRHSALAQDPALLPFLSPGQRQTLSARMAFGEGNPALLDNALESVRRLHAAGVRVLAGTDAPNPGTAHGVSMHDELTWLAQAGLTPAAALAAATSGPADAFGLADRGRIRAGLRADLVLVEGDPSTDLSRTRAIATIWKNGREVDRRYKTADVPVIAAGPVSHFDGATLDSRLGSGWSATSDRMAGGQSEAGVARVAGGAEGSEGALRVQGQVRPGAAQRWAGAFFNPGDQMMQAVDARAVSSLVMHVRGDGRRLSVLVFSGGQGTPPAARSIETTGEWARVELPLAEFTGVDAGQLRAIAITTGEPEGAFWFELDGVEIR
ncbi:CIA30 family protein [Arenimonas sp. MALMAid1274]|uniref:CIA30 family protein n=1 Tax=Arenimonas sp. MALMAid1274 TaxID=3411630 RepID=UPI003B9E2BD7